MAESVVTRKMKQLHKIIINGTRIQNMNTHQQKQMSKGMKNTKMIKVTSQNQRS